MIDKDKSRLLFEIHWKAVAGTYPQLQLVYRNGDPALTGDIELVNEEGAFEDKYTIEIHWVDKYPYRFPFVYEIGGRLPKNADWHVYPVEGNCCIRTQPEELLVCRKGITLSYFIKDEVLPYFFNQTYRRLNGFFLKERSHGERGNLEFYSEKFGTANLRVIEKLLQQLVKGGEHKATRKCFCGSNKKYKKCHRKSFRELAYLGRGFFSIALKNMQAYLQKENL